MTDKFSIDDKQANVLTKFPLAVLTYFFIIAFLALIAGYAASNEAILMYSSLGCVPIVVLLSIIQLKKIKKPKADIVDEKTISDISITPLINIGQVRDAVQNIFESIDTNTNEITQTFIRNNLIASGKDYLRNIILSIPDENKRPSIKRVFVIFNPLDINFAQSSIDFKIGNNEFNERYGDNLKNRFIYGFEESKLKDLVPNVTLVDSQCIITFPERTLTDSEFFPRKLVHNLESNTSAGIRIESTEFVQSYKNFLHKPINNNLDEIKNEFWKKDKLSYLYSIIYSICKELHASDSISSKVHYLGIVGSIAKLINNNEAASIIDINLSDFNDIDLLIIHNGITTTEWRVLFEICRSVCRRYSIHNTISFMPMMESTPIKATKTKNEFIEFPVHVLISEINGCENWDKFIATDRNEINISFSWVINENSTLNTFVATSFSLKEYLDGVYGLCNCIKILKGNMELPYKDWDLSKDFPLLIKKERALNDDSSKALFAKYALKWCSINFCNASDGIIKFKQGYIETFDSAIELISSYSSPDMIEKIKNINRKEIYEFNEDDYSDIIGYLEYLESIINKKSTQHRL